MLLFMYTRQIWSIHKLSVQHQINLWDFTEEALVSGNEAAIEQTIQQLKYVKYGYGDFHQEKKRLEPALISCYFNVSCNYVLFLK